MKHLDRLDRKILHELDLDASQPFSRIAKRLRLGSDLVEYRIRRLTETGVINRFTPVINPDVLGVQIFKTYIKHHIPKRDYAPFVRVLDSHPQTYWLSEGYGRWDLLYSTSAKSFGEFQSMFDRLFQGVGKYLVDLAFFPLVTVCRFPKHYLLGKGNSMLQWTSEQRKADFDSTDLKILAEISSNCRSADSEVARKLGITAAIVAYRRQKLEDAGAILGYRIQFDYSVMEMVVVKVFAEPRDFSPKLRANLLEFCRSEPRVTCFIQQIGSYPLELEVEMGDYKELTEFMDLFRERFGESMASIDTMVLTRDYYHRVPASRVD